MQKFGLAFVITLILISTVWAINTYVLPISLVKAESVMLFNITAVCFLAVYRLISLPSVDEYSVKIKVSGIKIVDAVFLLLFFTMLCIPASEINTAETLREENRKLAKFPPIVKQNKFNTAFGVEFDKWFSDRFRFRDELITQYSSLQFVNKIISAHNTILNPNTQWVFNKNLLKYVKTDDVKAQQISDALNTLYEFSKRHNIKTYVMIVPSKIDLYRRYAKPYAVRDELFSGDLIYRLQAESPLPILFPYPELKQASRQNLTFYKTEHHWTDWGAYTGYKLLVSRIQQDFPDVKVAKLSDFYHFQDRRVRGGFSRFLTLGRTFVRMHIDYPEQKLLDVMYDYYNLPAGISVVFRHVPHYRTKEFINADAGNNYKVFLTGTSMNESLLQFLPASFKHIKYYRLNDVKDVAPDDELKLLSRYRRKILKFKPDILIAVFTEENMLNLDALDKD